MKAIATTIQVSSERLVTLKLPDDISPGEHHVVVVIDEPAVSATLSGPLLDPEGLWADQGTDISPEDIAEARKEMWAKFTPEGTA